MLCDAASQSYFDSCRGKGINLSELAEVVKQRSQILEINYALLREWEILSLPSILSQIVKK